MAHETLTKQGKYDNWRAWGHPDGNRGIAALELMLPSFLLDEAFRPTLLMIALVGAILFTLAMVHT